MTVILIVSTSYEQQCSTTYETSYETKCSTSYEQQCSTVYETSYEKQCATSYKEVCSGGHGGYGGGYGKKCKKVPQ